MKKSKKNCRGLDFNHFYIQINLSLILHLHGQNIYK